MSPLSRWASKTIRKSGTAAAHPSWHQVPTTVAIVLWVAPADHAYPVPSEKVSAARACSSACLIAPCRTREPGCDVCDQ